MATINVDWDKVDTLINVIDWGSAVGLDDRPILFYMGTWISGEMDEIYGDYLDRRQNAGTLPEAVHKGEEELVLYDGLFDFEECGTAACIAGLMILLDDPERDFVYEGNDRVIEEASGLLGISCKMGKKLFMPDAYEDLGGRHLQDITRHEAVAVLKHFRKTGRIDWSVAWPQDG